MRLLNRLLSPNRKLAQTQEEFDKQASDFLIEYGFPNNQDYLAMYGSYVQMISPDQDSYNPDLLAKSIRKAVANELAFYLIKPDRRPKKEEPKDVQPVQNEGIQQAEVAVVSKTQAK